MPSSSSRALIKGPNVATRQGQGLGGRETRLDSTRGELLRARKGELKRSTVHRLRSRFCADPA